MTSLRPQTSKAIRIAVIGDVHDQWEPADSAALAQLKVDLALFVGDFGNEAVEVVRAIAALDLPKAAVLGNHDAWFSATEWGRKKCPYNRQLEDRVQQQLDLLGVAHVGYSKLELPWLNLTVVGGRPFSWGGSKWKHVADFYQQRYSIDSLAASTAYLRSQVEQANHETIIFVGHCGPAGLGADPEAPCGKDWNPVGGDYGDPDFAAAIALAQQRGKQVPLVTFGHMHHRLRHRQDRLRQRLVQDAAGTVYLNAASVPRIIKSETTCLRNFSLVVVEQGEVVEASLVWLDETLAIASQEVLYSRPVTSLSVG
ncbi:TIGR04168 family protein [Almyronema epifaneia]|uniref:TIGR04168 family protein n=1 Tax=Almyronema epifaneia S1 TaxID=2991925 RepID=A0ABW6IB37_9CYAN